MSGNELPKIAAGVISLVLAIGCAPSDYSPTPSPATEAATTIPTAISEPTQTPTRTPRPTDVPTRTPQPTSTIGPPEIPLSEDGPWLIFMAAIDEAAYYDVEPPLYLWAMNPDGTGLTLLEQSPVLTFTIRPAENETTVVYVVCDSWPLGESTNLVLKMITLPEQEATIIMPLVNPKKKQKEEFIYTLLDPGWYLWSADGKKFVFAGYLDDGDEVYSYDFTTGRFTYLTDTANTELIDYDASEDLPEYGDLAHTCCLEWSPDKRYVVYKVFPVTLMGLPEYTSLRAVSTDGERIIKLMEMGARYGVYGWHSLNEILLHDAGLYLEPDIGIIALNLDTGQTTSIINEAFWNAAYAKKYNAWLLVQASDEPLILYRNGVRKEIPNPGGWAVWWSESDREFNTRTEDTETGETIVYAITLDGTISVKMPTPDPMLTGWQGQFTPRRLVSPDETLWAWVDDAKFYGRYGSMYAYPSALWVGAPYVEPKLIFATDYDTDNVKPDDLLLYNTVWSPDSQRLIYLTNQGLYMAERPDFEPVLVAELYGIPWDYWRMTWMRHE